MVDDVLAIKKAEFLASMGYHIFLTVVRRARSSAKKNALAFRLLWTDFASISSCANSSNTAVSLCSLPFFVKEINYNNIITTVQHNTHATMNRSTHFNLVRIQA